MKIITLYSEVEHFIFAGIALITVMVFFNLLSKRLHSQEEESNYLPEDNVDINLDYYVLNFDGTFVKQKKISFKSQIILCVLAFAIICIPLNKLINF
ncbi:hypothetical protein ITJ86_01515 [Winogradskyella sp. F6397]|uniref:Uncharacterized protein n=1 Tax=Winogradskyella marina TaxID=2785530 RepID=A0ABS0EDT6_9FLAO|nr:hypothetical protein [Winogradskyella marina]MBF8148554.1 hypothetical protein [Winogradskyella marina]